jgi:hypothetical protein
MPMHETIGRPIVKRRTRLAADPDATPGEIEMKNTRCVHRLCFRSLFQRGRGFAFPCDRNGQVDLDGLTDRARNNYLFARAMVGRELCAPVVEADACEPQSA